MNSEVSLIRGCEEDAKGGDLRMRDTTPKKGLPFFSCSSTCARLTPCCISHLALEGTIYITVGRKWQFGLTR